MIWNYDTERRFTDLRLRELSGTLTETEQKELEQMLDAVDLAEGESLREITERWQSERKHLQEKLRQMEKENDELLHLLVQQEKLVTDARRWLREFEQRHESIQDNYKRLVGETTK